MKFTNVLVATNMNPLYYKFIPIFIKAWNKLFPNVKVTILVVAQELIDELLPYKDNIVLFPPIENMDTGFIAQNIRLLYPALMDAEGGILITDMDILPMNRQYYTQSIASLEDSKFITYRPLRVVGEGEIAICYNIATPAIWKDIFNINNIEDIHKILKILYKNNNYIGENAYRHYKPGWITDQLYLYEKVMEWNRKTNNHVILDDSLFKRLNRNRPITQIPKLQTNITKGFYSDYHLHRPYTQYKHLVDSLIDAIPPH